MRTIKEAAAALAEGSLTARELVEECLERIADPGGEGGRAFLKVYDESARAMADAADKLRAAGRTVSPYAGIPISIKDLFDVSGEPTRAGSVALADAPAATAHAPAIARLIAAGLIPVGRTNMTEFAFSGLGINPHHGTPRSPWRRAADGISGHIPGGSSSGAAVSVADGMAIAGIGTDTGGSCRIPAAMCSITGYKPTARRVPIDGAIPLAPSLDSIGPLANSVSCCAIVDAILAGSTREMTHPRALAGLRLGLPRNVVLDSMDADVAGAFERALKAIADAGARIVEFDMHAFDAIPAANARGGFAAAEAFAWHRALLASKGDRYDPRIRQRIERGGSMTAADYIDLCRARGNIIAGADIATREFDAMIMPTCPLAPPDIAALDDEAEYTRVNTLLLRNTTLANFLDRCAIALPCHHDGEPPASIMLVGETMGDTTLLAIAQSVECELRELCVS
jgi:aspartyl-tRNA(Asn)/glutamyl-tRNA(Gln) amidotransferase subunit A